MFMNENPIAKILKITNQFHDGPISGSGVKYLLHMETSKEENS